MVDESADEGDGTFESEFVTERRTAPQGPYTTRDVAVGAVITAIGILVTFAVPLLLA